ncbi:MAG TPA: hypothetical protein VK184_27540 [Nostocaceae cyanobacterium]|nr:hypothetical protein [Nostocaceae cyanobacterium]
MIKRLRLEEITTNTELFQFRSAHFSEERVQWLVNNWKPESLDPLDIWDSPTGQKILISGHHRLEAMHRRGDSSAPCRLHKISLEEAQIMAAVSNANRLQYTSFEYARCVDFFIRLGRSYTQAATELAINSDGMARKYHSLRHLIGTDWETQTDKLDLLSRAFEVANFCENNSLSKTEIQSLFLLVCKHDLTAPQLRQLLRDFRRQKAKQNVEELQLFDLSAFCDRTAAVLKERSILDNTAAQTWWLYELITNPKYHKFPDDIKNGLITPLRKLYAYCIGSENEEETPVRATKKGRDLKVSYHENHKNNK